MTMNEIEREILGLLQKLQGWESQGLWRQICIFLARQRPDEKIAHLSQFLFELHKACENFGPIAYNKDQNGEEWFLRRLAQCVPISVIFDVGANQGNWTQVVASIFPEAVIHAFEIVPETCVSLSARFAGNSRVMVNDIGLSDFDGELEYFYSPAADEMATAIAGFFEEFFGLELQNCKGTVQTGTRYCRDRNIETIDFLKIDVEGMEPNVLRGFEPMLHNGAIKVIQFEYGYININTHFLLRDFYKFLVPLGYRIGKLFPTFVDFRDYKYATETFYGANYVALHQKVDISNLVHSSPD